MMSTDDASVSIRLDQFMKLSGLAQSGGQAKFMVQHGEVSVNGAVETRRTRKLHPGDTVSVGEDSVQVLSEDHST